MPEATEVSRENNEPYAYMSSEVSRNSKGHNISVTVRTRPGEQDEQTLLRLYLVWDALSTRYPSAYLHQ